MTEAKAERNQDIMERIEDGESMVSVARDYGISHQRVSQIVRREKNKARSKVTNGVISGAITRPDTCEECGKESTTIEAHHPDYTEPLEVEWLCDECHHKRHYGERTDIGDDSEPAIRGTPYIISASGVSIDAIGENEDEAWAELSEAIGLSEDGLRASDSLEAVPATERLVERVREVGGSPKDVSWTVQDGTADLEDPGPTMERHNISIDRPRWSALEEEADRLGVSVSAVIRMAVDEYLG